MRDEDQSAVAERAEQQDGDASVLINKYMKLRQLIVAVRGIEAVDGRDQHKWVGRRRLKIYVDEHNMCLQLFKAVRAAMGESLTSIMWSTEPLAKRIAEVWCSQRTWKIRPVRVKTGATKLLTPQPLLHAADAPTRMARLAVRKRFYELTPENWSLQTGSVRRGQTPHETPEVDVDGPATTRHISTASKTLQFCSNSRLFR